MLKLRKDIFGCVVSIPRRGKTSIRLTFEEYYTRNSSTPRYICVVDKGVYRKYGLGYTFEVLVSFTIEDWFKYNSETTKRRKLRELVGYEMYNDLVFTLESNYGRNRVAMA